MWACETWGIDCGGVTSAGIKEPKRSRVEQLEEEVWMDEELWTSMQEQAFKTKVFYTATPDDWQSI